MGSKAVDRFLIGTFMLSLLLFYRESGNELIDRTGYYFRVFIIGLGVSFLSIYFLPFLRVRHDSAVIAKALHYFSVLVVVFMVTSVVGTTVNRKFAADGYYEETFSIVSKEKTHTVPVLWFVRLQLPEARKVIYVDRSDWEILSVGDELTLKIRKGFFGYGFVSGVSLN